MAWQSGGNTLWSDVTAALRDTPYRVVFDHPELDDRRRCWSVSRARRRCGCCKWTNHTEVLEEMVMRSMPGCGTVVIALHASPELNRRSDGAAGRKSSSSWVPAPPG